MNIQTSSNSNSREKNSQEIQTNSNSRESSSQEILFGWNDQSHIVAVEPVLGKERGNQTVARLYKRSGKLIHTFIIPYHPWLVLHSSSELEFRGSRRTKLEGNDFNQFYEFETAQDYYSARRTCQDTYQRLINYPGPRGVLVGTGITLFKGITYPELLRFQFDIETATLDPNHPNARILLIVYSTNSTSYSIGEKGLLVGDEETILRQLVTTINLINPDVIEGHNIYNFDFPYIIARAQYYGIELKIGRDKSALRLGIERRFTLTSKQDGRPYLPIYISGRHVIDTYFAVQRFDTVKKKLSSYGLKECARGLGFACDDRIELDGSRMAEFYSSDPKMVEEYALQDIIETEKLAALVCPSDFYQTMMVPDSYQQVSLIGMGEKINTIFVRNYLKEGYAIPERQEDQSFLGGFTEVKKTGVFSHIVKADVESLYPSLMLTEGIKPESDILNIFLPMLRFLLQERLEAKKKWQEAEEAEKIVEKNYWDGYQQAFKSLGNSMYGYLGGPFNFNDYQAAEQITIRGREIVKSISSELELRGAVVIEVDTDGCLFQPPQTNLGGSTSKCNMTEYYMTREEEEKFVSEAGKFLPLGIFLAYDGRYEKMLSVKIKNYILVQYDGKTIRKGASFNSRGDEKFLQKTMFAVIEAIMNYDLPKAKSIYLNAARAIQNHEIPIHDLCRRERITSKTWTSINKKKVARLAVGVTEGEYIEVYTRLDKQLEFPINYQKNEDIDFYLLKLYKFMKRIEGALGAQFPLFFTKPSLGGIHEESQLSLF